MYGFESGPTLRQYVIVITASLTFFQLGLGFGCLSPIIAKLSGSDQDVLTQPITETESAWIISISFLVGSLSLFVSTFVTDRFGRKFALVLCNIPRMIATVLMIYAHEVWLIILCRSLIGFSDCILSVTSTYIAEIASKEIRGKLGTISPIMAAVGTTSMLTIGPFLSYRSLQIMHAAGVIVTFLPLLWLPESPYLLYVTGNQEKSIQILNKIRTSKEQISEDIHEYTYRDTKINWKSLLHDKITFKTIGITFVIAFGSQASGYNAIFTNMQTIFKTSNTVIRPEVSSAVVGCLQSVACFVSISVIERFGRKPLMVCSFAGMGVGMAGVGLFFKLRETVTAHWLHYLPSVSIITLIFCDSFGVGIVIWVLIAELFDGPLRTTGVSFGVFVGAFSTFIITTYLPTFTSYVGQVWTYWIFAINSVLTGLFIMIFVPETRGKPFSQIQKELGRKVEEKV